MAGPAAPSPEPGAGSRVSQVDARNRRGEVQPRTGSHVLLRAGFAIYFGLRTRGPSVPPACAARVRVAGTNAWGRPARCTLTLLHTRLCRVHFPVRVPGRGRVCACVRGGFKCLASRLVDLPTGAQTCRRRRGQLSASIGAGRDPAADLSSVLKARSHLNPEDRRVACEES